MYDALKALLLRLLKVPPEPHDPIGDARTLRVFRAAPGYLRYITVGWLLTQCAILAGIVAADIPTAIVLRGSGLATAVLAVLTVLALLVFVAQLALTGFALRLDYELRWYKVTDRSLRIRSGVWNVSEMTMTFDNIQNITVTQGPIERLFGISDVRVTSAGGGEAAAQKKSGHGGGQNLHLGVFRGVDNPDEIRDLMLARLRRLRDTGLGDPTDDRAHEATADWMPALRSLRDEAAALKQAAERL